MGIRDELREVRAKSEDFKLIPKWRAAVVHDARAQGLTWDEIATLLGMSSAGVRRSYDQYKGKK